MSGKLEWWIRSVGERKRIGPRLDRRWLKIQLILSNSLISKRVELVWKCTGSTFSCFEKKRLLSMMDYGILILNRRRRLEALIMGKVGRPKGSKNKTPADPTKKKKGKPRNPQKNFGQENVEPGDNARYLRHALKIAGLPPIDISDEKQVQERLDWYFQHCLDDDMKPTVTGMCNALGISKETMWNWKTGETRKGTHLELIKKYYYLLESLWEDYMMNGKINPASGIFMGKNHFGYRDEVEVSVRPPEPLGEEPDRKLLDAKLADVVQELDADFVELDERNAADSQNDT